ncbi:MAG: xanthine dehydrogenase family protein molybdopterin-binding subunit [Thaumarchaeota archaeon]|nr:xanthine dehydrogenase family protein molybdopterin-binding subunit [Nitrososphaerota archaeon]
MVVRKWVGKSIKRREDPRFLTGKGTFVDDFRLQDMCYAAFLRSPYAHAKIRRLDVSRVLERPGVLTVISGEELVHISEPQPGRAVMEKVKEYPLAVEKVGYQGQPLAAVVATTRGLAEDALDDFDVEYEPLEVIVDPEEAASGNGPLIMEELGSNVAWHGVLQYGEPDEDFAEADLVVEEKFKIPRYSSTALEPNGCVASYDHVSDMLTVWSNAQTIQGIPWLSRATKIPPSRIRIIIGDLGGGFGTRHVSRELMVLTALLSIKTGRPVKYVEDRKEMMISTGNQSHGGIYELKLALRKDGTFLALRLKDITDEGASPSGAGQWFAIKLTNITGLYKIKSVYYEGYSVLTNLSVAGSDRGLGKPHMAFMLERLVDLAAKKLNMDPVEIRLKNFVQPDQMPYTTPSGNIIDGGDFTATFRKALEMVNYKHWMREREKARHEGRLLGIGIACNVDPGGHNPGREVLLGGDPKAITHRVAGAVVRVDPLGKVAVLRSAVNMGTAHETSLAQVMADELGVNYDDVYVVPLLDTYSSPWTTSSGTAGDLYSSIYLGAAVTAARKVREKMARIAASMLDTSLEEIEFVDGKAFVKDSPQRSVAVKDIASAAYHNVVGSPLLPEGVDLGLHEAAYFYAPQAHPPDEKNRISCHYTYGNQTHVAVVEVDRDTGRINILKYLVAHDSGTIINPMTIDGQVHGHVSHFISVALGEQYVYDEEGQLLTSTFADYFKPTAVDSIDVDVVHLETPSTWAPIGAKAVGEGPTIPVMPAIASAVEDALAAYNVMVTEIPITSEKVWSWIHRGE